MPHIRVSARGFMRLGAAALTALALLNSPVQAAANTQVGVSVSVSQPGFYGRVDIGPQPPEVIYQQPIIIEQTPVAVYQRPIYMRVPPGHSRNWARYCQNYRACGQPVYFVREMAPARHDERDDRRHDRHDRDERGDRGHGEGRGHGKGKGHGHGHD